MTYRAVLTPRAKQNLITIYSEMFERAAGMAQHWLARAEHAIDSLDRHPERCPLAPEGLSFCRPIRQLLFGSGNRGTYRLLFEIKEQTVYVLHVRHGSRLPLSPLEE